MGLNFWESRLLQHIQSKGGGILKNPFNLRIQVPVYNLKLRKKKVQSEGESGEASLWLHSRISYWLGIFAVRFYHPRSGSYDRSEEEWIEISP